MQNYVERMDANLAGSEESHKCKLYVVPKGEFALKGIRDFEDVNYVGLCFMDPNHPNLTLFKNMLHLINVDYNDLENYKTLRYGKIILDENMDQVLSFVRKNHPTLLKYVKMRGDVA